LVSGSVRGLATRTYRRLAVTAHDAAGRALRYARGSARGLLHHAPGHNCESHQPSESQVTQRIQDVRGQTLIPHGPGTTQTFLARTGSFQAHFTFLQTDVSDGEID